MSGTGFVRGIIVLALVLAHMVCAAGETDQFASLLARGAALRQSGNLTLSIDALRQALAQARTPEQRDQASAELGAAYLASRQPDLAEPLLRGAYDHASGHARAGHALMLANLAAQRGQTSAADTLYLETRTLAGASPLALRAQLNSTLRRPSSGAQLAPLFDQIAASGAPAREQAELLVSLAQQAQKAEAGPLAFRAGDRARQLLAGAGPSHLQAEILDQLAQVYESAGRSQDALALSQQGMAILRQLPPASAGDLAIPLEARQGRLYSKLGEPVLALAAYQRAAERIEAQRLDIPIEFDDGSSSYSTWFEPVFLGLADALLKASEAAPPAQAQDYLRRSRDAVEQIKQAELQDYLGDRCTVDAVKGGTPTVIPAGTAVLYPILFADRVELLLETAGGMVRFTSPAPGATVHAAATAYAADLRNGNPDFMPRARQLYDWLLRPLAPAIAAHNISTLVVVPDGALRLVPFGALHDGSGFAIERMALATVTGMSMTNTTAPPATAGHALVAGASEFGPVVGKFMQTTVGQRFVSQLRSAAPSRSLTTRSLRLGAGAGDVEQMRQSLALPGVAREVAVVGKQLGATSMLDAGFTVASFSGAVQSDNFGIVHVASHGMFGGTGASSFVLAYDDLLTLDGLQALLRNDKFRRHPIELLTLSACETADGNERAPLGMSGAAMKARAKSVLGALWPVEDEAAVAVMGSFYGGITQGRLGKAAALRQAQLNLMANPAMAHPAFWAPFTLIGNWL